MVGELHKIASVVKMETVFGKITRQLDVMEAAIQTKWIGLGACRRDVQGSIRLPERGMAATTTGTARHQKPTCQ